jgi:signal transduction histidine kinase
VTRILVVDDDEQDRYLLEAFLGGSGHEVFTATDGAEALRIARKDAPDIIITDILMPVMDGFTLCRHWKADEQLKRIPFVFYSGTYTDSRDEVFALSLGAERFIVKPQEPDAFMELLRGVLEEAQAGTLHAPCEPQADETVLLRKYSEALIRSLDGKIQQLADKNRQLEEQLGRIRALQQEVLHAAGDEQRRIGHDLHDGLTQEITALGLMARGLHRRLVAESSPHADALDRFCRAIQDTWQHSRRLAHGLLVVDPDTEGLTRALEDLAEETAELSHVACEFTCETPVPVEDNATATHLYRIAQEAIHNAVRHGRAQRLDVSLTKAGKAITLRVADDGSGMKTDAQTETTGMGLRIMQYRSDLIGASLDIQSVVGDGTIVTCALPLRPSS